MTQLASITEELTGKVRVSYEEFLALPGNPHAEWVDGEVIPMMSVSSLHTRTHKWLLRLMDGFLDEQPMGETLFDPFQMKLAAGLPGRQPDISYLSNEHAGRLRDTFLDGPADLAIEIVSPGNAATDYVDKFREYEAGGVPEYWIIDPFNETADFFRLVDGRYERSHPDKDGVYHCAAIPGFWLRVEWLWKRPPLKQALAEIEAAAG